MASQPGLRGLVDSIDEQRVARSTGAIGCSPGHCIFIVFGYPLHATADASTGMPAVAAIAELLLSQPEREIDWSLGVTAGAAHSLTAADRVADYLRGRLGGPALQAEQRPELRQPEPRSVPVTGATDRRTEDQLVATDWTGVAGTICALAEARLKRQAAPLTAMIYGAHPDARSLLQAIERARLRPVRMVSAERWSSVLDEAEALVTDRL